MRTLLLVLLASGTFASESEWESALGQAPAAAEARVLRRFDFEEREIGNFEELPMHWNRVTGPGLPHYVSGRLSTDAARSGRHSFRLDVDGGSVLFRLDPTVLPVQEGAFYRVRSYAKTTPLRFARARMTAFFVDKAGQMVPGTARHSPAISGGSGSAGGKQSWQELAVELAPAPAGATHLVIELGLLQPGQLGAESQTAAQGVTDARHDLTRFRQDVRGSAWFDDVVAARVPSLRLGGSRPGNVYPAGSPVRLRARVNDRGVSDLEALLVLTDASGRQVASRQASAGPSEGPSADLAFDLGVLETGWYEASVTVAGGGSEGEASTRRSLSLVVLADDDRPAPLDRRIAVDATHLPMKAWGELPVLLPGLSGGRVKLAVWSRENDLGPGGFEASTAFDEVAGQLSRAGVGITGVFAAPTQDLSEVAGGPTWGDLLRLAEDAERGGAFFEPAVAFLVSRHAHQIARWQVGRDTDADRFARDANWRRAHARMTAEVARLVARPQVALPWPAREGLPTWTAAGPPTVALTVPPEVLPHQIPLYVQEAVRNGLTIEHEAGDLSVGVIPLDANLYGRDAHLRDLARRITYTLASGVGRVTVPMPFDAVPSGPGHEADVNYLAQPRENYLVLRTMLRHLAGRQFRGRVPAGEGVEAFLFSPVIGERPGDVAGSQGVVVFWSDGSVPDARLQINLGRDSSLLDVWGRGQTLEPSRASDAGLVSVPAASMPQLVTGVDAGLTRLRAMIRLDDPYLESSFRPHVRKIRVENPYGVPVAGRLEVRPPAGWEAVVHEPRLLIPPGGAIERDVELRFPYNSFAGPQRLDVSVVLDAAAGAGARRVTVPLAAELGLRDASLRTVAWRENTRGRQELVVEQTILNHGRVPATWTAFVLLPGSSRQERLVIDLPPGQSVVRRYRFPAPPAGRLELRSGLRELEGDRILNERVVVE